MKKNTTDKHANKTTAELEAEMLRLFQNHLEFLAEDCGDKFISMTAATGSIWGTSGKGHPRAVRIIETLAEYGYLEIQGSGKRQVKVSSKGHELLAGK
jgi:hypothetical protein